MALIGEMHYLTIGGNTYAIPTSGGSTVSVTRALTSGTKTATISVDGTSYDLYAPTPNAGTITSVKTTAGAHTAINVSSGTASFNVPTKTSHLTNDSGFITSYTDEKVKTDLIPSTSETYYLTLSSSNASQTSTLLKASELSVYYGSNMTKLIIGESNTDGMIRLYDGGNHYVDLGINGNLSDNRFIYFPDKRGVVALTDDIPTVPTNISAFINDAGYLTSYTETDPTVPSWAKASTKPSYTANEVGALPSTTSVVNDLQYNTTQKSLRMSKNGVMQDVITVETLRTELNVPTNTSQLTNDSGFLTSHQDISGKANKATTLAGYGITDAYTKTQVDGLVAGVLHYKGTKATVSALPTSGNTTGDVWHVTADGSEWAWDGSTWQELGTAIDLSGYAQLTGASFTGPVTFGNSVTADELETGDLVVTGAASFTNNIATNTINGVAVGSSPKFTDTVTTVTTTGSGNAITAISATNGAITATKGTTFLTSHQTVSNKGATLAWGAATTVATIGSTDIKVSLPANPNTHNTAYLYAGASNGTANAATTNGNTYLILMDGGTATTRRKISGATNVSVASDSSGNITITGPNLSGYALSSAIPTKTSQLTNDSAFLTTAVTSISTAAGTHTPQTQAVTGNVSFNIPTKTSHLVNDSGFITDADIPEGASAYTGTISAVSTTAANGTSNAFARGDHVHNITGATVKSALGTGSGTTKFLREDGSWATPAYTTNTDTKLQVAAVTSGTTYYPIVGTGTTAATRQYDTTGFIYKGTNGTTSAIGSAQLTLGNSTASGTANNKQGQLILYGSTAYAHTISGAPTAARTLTLPNASGTIALTSDIPSIPTSTGSATTGITASTTATKTTLGTAFTIPNVTSAGSASTWAFEEVSIPNVTAAGSASTWTFGATTVGDGTLVGAVDSSDTSMLVITAGTKSVQQKTGGANGTAPTIGTAIKVQSKKSGANGSAPTLGTAFTVPNVTGNTSATVSITDNGHTHTI